ncbi:polyphenol oxidase family protein [Campylobacter majalis]|uniref:polyphenol oxidase family protein n=1 Tax=Campylobacter majalis TaxID=2790656 RepID=UPI003D69CD2E
MGNSREIFKSVLDDGTYLAGYSTRYGGVSKGKYESLNLALHVGDDEKSVYKNREILREYLGFKKLIFMHQTHSDIIKILKNESENLGECDGIITNMRSIGLCVMVADCSPILLVSKNAVAAIHAGRQGVIKRIVSKCVKIMRDKFNAHDIKAYIGANISAKNYEIGDMDLGEFNAYKNGKNFDLNMALADEFDKLNIKNTFFSNQCTFESDEFFSYRKSGVTGRFAGVVGFK